MKYILKTLKIMLLTICIAVACVALVLVIAFLAKDEIDFSKLNVELPQEVSDFLGVEPVTVEGYNIEEITEAELTKTLKKDYPWDFKIVGDGVEVVVEDAITDTIDTIVNDAYTDGSQGQYYISLSDDTIANITNQVVSDVAVQIVAMEKSGELMKYNAETDSFEFQDLVVAPVVDDEKLKNDVKEALENKEFVKEISIVYSKEAEVTSASNFKLIGTFETKAAVNSNRNDNITLACNTVNGTILMPDEVFSYNEVLGKRTPDKGYKQAGVYLNGEHTVDYGGGICQLSSTLYNAIFAANLEVLQRTGHTFEPTYVRPGLDATVSYPEPEFIFKNSSEYPVGISCHFEDQIVTVDIYGVPTLEEGVTRYMRSERIGDIPAPAIIYQDNAALLPGEELVVRAGYGGSKWSTYEVLEKDGEVISDTYIYTTNYKGEAPIVQKNFLYNF